MNNLDAASFAWKCSLCDQGILRDAALSDDQILVPGANTDLPIILRLRIVSSCLAKAGTRNAVRASQAKKAAAASRRILDLKAGKQGDHNVEAVCIPRFGQLKKRRHSQTVLFCRKCFCTAPSVAKISGILCVARSRNRGSQPKAFLARLKAARETTRPSCLLAPSACLESSMLPRLLPTLRPRLRPGMRLRQLLGLFKVTQVSVVRFATSVLAAVAFGPPTLPLRRAPASPPPLGTSSVTRGSNPLCRSRVKAGLLLPPATHSTSRPMRCYSPGAQIPCLPVLLLFPSRAHDGARWTQAWHTKHTHFSWTYEHSFDISRSCWPGCVAFAENSHP